jgi:hypothetical protein
MPLSPNINTREADKFALNSDGDTAVRTLSEITSGSVTGTFTASGLTIAGRITTVDIGDTATALPAVALSQRNALAIHNTSETDAVYIGYSSAVTADNVLGTTSGWYVGPNENFNIDITESIILYAICETGKTCRVKINEVA